MNMKYISSILILTALLFSGCEKFFEFEQEVDFSQGNTESKIVVQSVIQPGYPAYAIVTRTEPYFSAITDQTIDNLFVNNATITMSNESGETVELVNINAIPSTGIDEIDATLDSIAVLYPGFYVEWPCDIFVPPPYSTLAEYNKSFSISVIVDQDSLFATTTIPNEHLMDSLWFEIDEMAPRPNLGNIWFHYSDPDTLGNTIMIEHKRLAHTKEVFWGDNPPDGNLPNTFTVKQTSDPLFAKALWGFVRNDFEGLNGTSFDTYFQRGNLSSTLSATFDEVIFEQDEQGYFKAGQTLPEHDRNVYADTVLVRISQIDNKSFLFWRSLDYQASSNGNPFAEPINLQSNVTNGYGVFYGQASIYYKVIAKEDTTYIERYYPIITEIL
ncbi:MAG: hypothetical protein CMC95_03440 [Flavobacteriales bacterium]|jgi:hypothetical protein|nr:hypothetical protein [Flavobacteriales bacterium]